MNGPHNWTDEKGAAESLKNMGTDLRFQCYHENDATSCHQLGDFLAAIQRDTEKAKKVYETNCLQHKFGHSCYEYGQQLLKGRGGMKKNMKDAYEFYTKGCEYGHAGSCRNAGLVERSEKNYRRAESHLGKACNLNDIDCCYILSTFYLEGKEGVPVDHAKAAKLSQKACDQGHLYSCVNLSILYRKGLGVEKNLELAQKYHAKAKEMYQEQKAQMS